MKHFMPFSDELLKDGLSESDHLVPYQVGMSCLEWYQIGPRDIDHDCIEEKTQPIDTNHTRTMQATGTS